MSSETKLKFYIYTLLGLAATGTFYFVPKETINWSWLLPLLLLTVVAEILKINVHILNSKEHISVSWTLVLSIGTLLSLGLSNAILVNVLSGLVVSFYPKTLSKYKILYNVSSHVLTIIVTGLAAKALETLFPKDEMIIYSFLISLIYVIVDHFLSLILIRLLTKKPFLLILVDIIGSYLPHSVMLAFIGTTLGLSYKKYNVVALLVVLLFIAIIRNSLKATVAVANKRIKELKESNEKINLLATELDQKLAEIEQFNQHKKNAMEQEKLAIIGQMAAGMAHEIRNPLTSVKGLCQIISTRVGLEKEEYKELFFIINNEINQANDIIREFLAFAKPKPPSYQLVSPNSLVDEISILIDSLCLMKNIKLKKLLDDNMPLCQLDSDQVKQVLLNIVHNAIEAMDECDIRLLTLGTSFFMPDNKIKITISDTGLGIPSKNLKRIGTPFFTTKSKGTGLGLSVSLKKIESHKGSVDIKSIEGKGTTFTITLPVIA